MTRTPAARTQSPASDRTTDAIHALRDTGFSRRGFLLGAGALVVSFSLRTFVPSAGAQFEGGEVGPAHDEVDSWLAVASDGSVTAYTGKEELGQGISTAQIQLVAEELCVPFERVKLIYCDTALTPDQGVTSGSQSSPTNFNHANLAQAAATARQALIEMASKRLKLSPDRLVAVDGAVVARGDASTRLTYGQLIGGRKFAIRLDGKAPRKPPAEWTILGKPAQRPDLPDLVTGQFEFVHNMRLPGMLHGRVVRPPTVGAKVIRVDESSVAGMPGLVKVVVRENLVGVVAEKPWQAIQAASRLKVSWSSGTGLPKFETLYDWLRHSQPTRDTLLVNSQDVDRALSSAAQVVRATYYYPFQMHSSMGPSCAVADVRKDKATIYSPTQAVWHQRNTCAMILGLKPEDVRVIFRRGSGCYGCNGADAVTFDAAILSQAAGKPVKVQFSRKDEMAWGENYGFAFVLDERAGLDPSGNILAWDHESWSPVRGNRPGMTTPGNVVSGMLAGFPTEPFEPQSPAPEPTAYSNNSNGVPSYVAGNVAGKLHGTGTVRSERSLVHNCPSPFFTGPLRSPARLQNTFAHESFVDELAAQAKADPVEYRLRHVSDARLADVIRAAAKAANWDPRPSPKQRAPNANLLSGRGMACVAYEGNNGYAAMVLEVEVNPASGRVQIGRIFVANDSGPISNPDGLRNQLEGGALQGLSRALGEEVTWDDQKVTSFDWRTYHTLPLGFTVPQVEVTLLNRTDVRVTGAGETSITIAAAALANAIFDATGARLRQVPFTPERVRIALA